MTARSTPRAITYGLLAAVPVSLAYAVISEPLELTPTLLVVAFFGGWLIGHAVSYGAWHNNEHEAYRPLQWYALALVILGWAWAIFVSFVISQALIPQSSLPLGQRLTVDGLFGYLGGLELVPVFHVLSLALMAFMAWRGAR